MRESVIERELALRIAAMSWLTRFGPEQTFRYEQLAQFEFRGERIPLSDRGRGIRKPASLSAALSFSTVFTAPNRVPPYEDAEGRDGLLRYKMRGDDPHQPENAAMRAAYERQLPLIWFVGVAPGLYLPRYPVFLVGEERGQFVVALDQAQRNMADAHNTEVSEDDRRYAEAITRRRLHQPLFRARVLQAYESRCSMCHLRHASLLDASHILDDKHVMGQPVVPNGLALCKIHHAGFDQNIIGVSPDLTISVRRDILEEVDGPMLRFGIQALEGQRITVPRQRVAAPDQERLALRFAEFRNAAA